MLDDVSKATAQARSLGVQGFENLPSQLTPEQRKQAADSIKNIRAEIYTGKDDTILRRMHIRSALCAQGQQQRPGHHRLRPVDLRPEQGPGHHEPSNAKPFDQLLSQLGGLGLGGTARRVELAGGASTAAAPTRQDFKKYSDCVAKAGTDAAKAQECADLLTG